jgi:HEAT repeat protein
VACACLIGCGEAPDLPQPIERTSTATRSTPAVSVEHSLIPVYARDVSIDPAKDPNPVDPDELIGSVTLALADSDANVRADAVSALGSAHDNPEAASLAHAALSDADPAVREAAAYALGEIGGEMSLRALEQALRDPEHDVKSTAIEALASIGGDQAALALAPILDDPDATLRAAAVDALSEIAGPH